MQACNHFYFLKAKGVPYTFRIMFTIVKKVANVTVLLLLLTSPYLAQAQDVKNIYLQTIEFSADFRTHLGQSHLKGLMNTDTVRHRITIYWTEPKQIREHKSFIVSACDILLTEKNAHFWVPGMSEPGVLRWTGCAKDPLLPQQENTQSVVRSALRIFHWLRCTPEGESDTIHLHRFLRDSRLHPEYTYGYATDDTDSIGLITSTTTDKQILNGLPLGRQYVKATSKEGMLQWRLTKALNNQSIMRVIVKRMVNGGVNVSSTFDPKSLGQWLLIPEPYRIYWSLHADYLELISSMKPGCKGIDVCRSIKSKLDTRLLTNEVRRALERLWFDASLAMGDISHLHQSLQATVVGFCCDDNMSTDYSLMELGIMAKELESSYPQHFQAVLNPCVTQIVQHAGEDIAKSFSRLIKVINSNKWFGYGDLLLEAIRLQGSVEHATCEDLASRYEAARLTREIRPFDLSKSCTTVKQYLLRIDDAPLPGSLTMEDVREVVDRGLARYYPVDAPKTRYGTTENIINSLRMIVGEGPFRGRKTELIRSIERLAKNHYIVCCSIKPIDMTLVTFLALSFHDISTPQDHELLCRQMGQLAAKLQTRLNTKLRAYAMHMLVTPNDVQRIFQQYCEKEFRSYLDDPLCPTFKFPLSANETVRLTNKLKLRFSRLEPLFEEMSLKVKYGGVSKPLKEKTILGISQAVQNLLASMAFIRRPAYIGVTCHYRGVYGFSTVIPETLYLEGHRPKERFKAMQYFHLGHILEDYVKNERRLAQQKLKKNENETATGLTAGTTAFSSH